MLATGSQIKFHAKVNIDPLGSHCSLCGRKTDATLWIPLDWDDRISLEINTDDFKGYFPVGSECAKQFAKEIISERH